jgi:hypothetical protein
MKNISWFCVGTFVCLMGLGLLSAQGQRTIPDPLKTWQDWATWDVKDRDNPRYYNDPQKRPGLWPSRLSLDLTAKGGRFNLTTAVFEESWIPLPGSAEMWPQQVTANGASVPVVQRNDVPSVRLTKGNWRLTGTYSWDKTPQRVQLPPSTGVLSLTVDGKAMPSASWDASGTLWLRAPRTGEAEKDFLSVQIYRALEDGIPMWLRTEIELTVSGKSREEEIGYVLPEGWKLAQVTSPLPVALDESGQLKAQVRAGRWTIKIDAFRLTSPESFGYAPNAKPAVPVEWIAFQAKPAFRLIEITGIPSVDVSQTTVPAPWRNLPVYQWSTAEPFKIEERMRGMGLQRPEGLTINRELWLDQNGRGLTFRDGVRGRSQEIWRLDAAAGQELGSVRMDGEGQLITLNPVSGAQGVEVRTRNLNLEATGRSQEMSRLPATGWQADADSVKVEMNLPPGWRLLAVFGADWVTGDWLTSWTLLDLFLLLVLSLGVFKLWGPWAGILAFVAFGLSYHEPDAPRYTWLFLLLPIALLRVVPPGWARRLILVWKWIGVAAFVVVAAPFFVAQIQAALYPQLEPRMGTGYFERNGIANGLLSARHTDAAEAVLESAPAPQSRSMPSQNEAKSGFSKSKGKDISQNMVQQAEARIQTGPGVPEWRWRTVAFGWNGPVQASQTVRTFFIPVTVERFIMVLRVLLILALIGVLLDAKRAWISRVITPARTSLLALLLTAGFLGLPQSHAQMPDSALLQTLQQRLLEVPDAFPQAASIPQVSITLQDTKVIIETEIHTAVACAVPLPGRLPSWSPVSILVNGQSEVAARRDEGFIWVALPQGVHQVRVEGWLSGGTDWECAFPLKPYRLIVNAPGWSVTGIRPNGVPEGQVFFNRQQQIPSGEASYDHRDYQAVVLVDRTLEVGLVWKVRTRVSRLSPLGKAVSISVPLLPGENVLTANLVVTNGEAAVRLGAQDAGFLWESELPQTETVQLTTQPDDSWVERWKLLISPVWNVQLTGLNPVFESDDAGLVPVWQPWPGEKATLTFSRPEAVQGATVTVRRAQLSTEIGNRQRTNTLQLTIECSLGQEFGVALPSDTEISSVNVDGQNLPVRKDGERVILTLKPGPQTAVIQWRENKNLGLIVQGPKIQLPVESANVSTTMTVPDSRWVLWTGGPMQGPAVRFWVVLICALIIAWILGSNTYSPIKGWEWMLLALGLTQVHWLAASIVIAWFFLLSWRGLKPPVHWAIWKFNLLQVVIILLTGGMILTLIAVVSMGLLGNPDMFITGNGSSPESLKWFEPRVDDLLPQPFFASVSIWFYRLFMLGWALWLAASLLRWLKWAWEQFSKGGVFLKPQPTPPPVPPSR